MDRTLQVFLTCLRAKILNMMSSYHHVESSATHNPPPENTYDVRMPDASRAPNLKLQYGINAMNNLVS